MPRRPLVNPLLASVVDAPPRPRRTAAVVADTAVVAAPAARPIPDIVRGPRRASARGYLAVAGVGLALGGLSLLEPSTPSYDPWSWTLWGREIVHGQLVITTTGSSWKPLPMLATIPLALTGAAAPDLWLVIARAGLVVALALAFRLAYRLTAGVARRSGAIGTRVAADGARSAVCLPALLAGLVALIGLGLAPSGFASASALGYSEGLATALLLAAIELHLDGRPRASFALGFLVALDRPEVWLFWVPYGLWLARRDPAMRRVVLLALVLQPLLWFGPVELGSGHLGSSVTRATHPRSNSDAFAAHPFFAELRGGVDALPLRVRLAAAGFALAATAVLARAVARRGASAVRDPRLGALAGTLGCGLGGLAWLALIALMTELGFSGNGRYLVLGDALLDICAGVAFGWLAIELARLLPLAASSLAAASLAAPALAALTFLFVPGWIGDGELLSLPRLHGALAYQARLRGDLRRVIAADGGSKRVLECGRVMTEGFQVPMVAYALGVATPRVLAPPLDPSHPGPAPDVVLQTRDTRGSRELPRVRWWPGTTYVRHPGRGPFHLYTDCGSSS